MNVQKFKHGDFVRVAKDLGPSMSHFQSDCDAIVIGSYRDQYGGNNTTSYTLHLKGRGQSSWYDEWQLTLIESGCTGMIAEWERELEEERKRVSDLDWIFANGAHVLERCAGATAQALADCMGLGSLWGSHGEGITFYSNAVAVLGIARPYLESGDKAGWLAHCKTVKKAAGADHTAQLSPPPA